MRPRTIAPCLLLAFALPAAVAADGSRYRATATIEVRRASDDGRYAVVAHATQRHDAKSADGRYTFKATSATCDPADDRLFANGFETP